jgi:predicted XRE-type DNA-binding protein
MPRRARRKTAASSARKAAAALKRDAISRTLLAREVQRQLKTLGLTQTMAARIVNDAATQMSRLMNGHFVEFSADRLVRMLLRLGSDVTVTIKHAPRLGRRGRAHVRTV